MDSQNVTSVNNEKPAKRLPKFVLALCYILLVVVLLVSIFLGLKTYGEMQMQTSVGYALGSRKSFSLFMVLNDREMDDVTIRVTNAHEDNLTLLPENMVRHISVTIRYMQFVDLPGGGSETRYATHNVTVIEFVNTESANEYFEKVEKKENRDQYVDHRYYFDLVPDEDIMYLPSNPTTEEYNDYIRHEAAMDIRGIATGFGPFVYSIFG